MKIALDYDDTYTKAPTLWHAFVVLALMGGHEVALVTFRFAGGANDDINFAAKELGIPVVFTGARQKSHCYKADIWIDDMPELIPSYDMLRAMSIGCENNKDFGGES